MGEHIREAKRPGYAAWQKKWDEKGRRRNRNRFICWYELREPLPLHALAMKTDLSINEVSNLVRRAKMMKLENGLAMRVEE